MTIKLEKEAFDFVLQKMESILHDIATNYHVYSTAESIIKKVGEFQAFKELLDNSDYESYGLKVKVIFPTRKEYEDSLPNKEDKI